MRMFARPRAERQLGLGRISHHARAGPGAPRRVLPRCGDGRVATAIESAGPESPEAQRRIADILRYSRIELVLLLGLVFMMVVKLGT
jgi:hypothetical protein